MAAPRMLTADGGEGLNSGFLYMWSTAGVLRSEYRVILHQGFSRMDLRTRELAHFELGDVVKVHTSVQTDPPRVAEIISLFQPHGDSNNEGRSRVLCVLRWFIRKVASPGYVER